MSLKFLIRGNVQINPSVVRKLDINGVKLRISTISDCKPGTYLNLTYGLCLPCPRGFYQSNENAIDCVPCTSSSSYFVNSIESLESCQGTFIFQIINRERQICIKCNYEKAVLCTFSCMAHIYLRIFQVCANLAHFPPLDISLAIHARWAHISLTSVEQVALSVVQE